ncbi:MAG: hypothetical protein DMG61_16800 [Acidobacteria bacterium]|nr:MAG: hypothetical protein DMG61_16800 [Acidobacteriota bacterium]
MAFIDALPRLRQAGFLPVHGVSPSLIEMFSPPAGFAPAGFFWKKHSAFSTQHSAFSQLAVCQLCLDRENLSWLSAEC